MIDTHAHIYADAFDADRESCLQQAMAQGIEAIIMPNIDLASIPAMRSVYLQHTGYCFPSMGLHPCSVTAHFMEDLRQMETQLAAASMPFVAIGETGLDYYWDKSLIQQQQASFSQQLDWAVQKQLPIIIHSRDSLDDCIHLVRQHQKGMLTGVFHCFSGSREQADQVIDLGFHLGIGGVLTFKNGGLNTILQPSDLPWLLLETDAPYLAPVPHRGKRNEPAYLSLVAQSLSALFDLPLSEIGQRTTANARSLFFKSESISNSPL